MEGIGYWLFLAAMYFLLSLMKKRQQKVARRMLDEDELVQESDQQPGPFQSETLQELFNEIKNFGQDILEPEADGFRNYQKKDFTVSPEEMLLNKSQLLGLSAPEMTVLLGGMRALGISANGYSCFTETPGKLTNDFFVRLLDMSVEWKPINSNSYEATDRISGEKAGTASRVDLVFGSNSQLRALAEFYASEDSKEKFINDFIQAWNKVMNADRFDLL